MTRLVRTILIIMGHATQHKEATTYKPTITEEDEDKEEYN